MLRSKVAPTLSLALMFTTAASASFAQSYPAPGGNGYLPPGQQNPAALQSLLQNMMNAQPAGQQPYGQSYQQPQQPYGQNTYPNPYTPQAQTAQPQPGQQSAAGAQAEAAFRRNLMMHSMGFGGLFGPALKQWVETPSQPGSGGN